MPLKEQTRLALPTMALGLLLLLLSGAAAWALHSLLRNQVLADRLGLALLVLGMGGAVAGMLSGIAVARRTHRRLLDSERAAARGQQLATLGRVAAALAHELRNPLTSMRIVTQSAVNSDGHVTIDAEDFAILAQEIERLDNAIQTFLDYARPPRPEIRPCIVQTLVRQTMSLIERRAAQIGVELREDISSEPIEIAADPGQIKQVILNILLNALDASPDGGTVTVRSRIASLCHGPAPGGLSSRCPRMVQIEIADAGVGLPAELGERVFEAFVSTKETGTGLGLAICRRIVDDHGGELTARNAPGGGAVFTIHLPQIQKVSL